MRKKVGSAKLACQTVLKTAGLKRSESSTLSPIATQVCSKCKISKLLVEFHWKVVGLTKQGHCKSCYKLIHAQWYKDNRLRAKANIIRQKRKALAWMRDQKQGPCTDCQQCFHFSAMDFDHLEDKYRGLAQMAIRGTGIAAMQKEIAKCELVCANCHRIRTYNRRHARKAMGRTANPLMQVQILLPTPNLQGYSSTVEHSALTRGA